MCFIGKTVEKSEMQELGAERLRSGGGFPRCLGAISLSLLFLCSAFLETLRYTCTEPIMGLKSHFTTGPKQINKEPRLALKRMYS